MRCVGTRKEAQAAIASGEKLQEREIARNKQLDFTSCVVNKGGWINLA